MIAEAPTDNVLAEIQAINKSFTETLRLEPLLERIIEAGMRLAGGDSGSIMLLSDDGRELVVAAAVGSRSTAIIGSRQPIGTSIAGKAIQTNSHVLITGMANGDGGHLSDHPRELGWGLVLPLRVSGRLLGVLNVNTGVLHEELPRERVSWLSMLASQSAIMIEVGRLYQDLDRKEERLELFVDRFLRMQAEARDPSAGSKSAYSSNGDRGPGALDAAGRGGSTARSGVAADLSERLSARELEVLALIVEGLTNKEIAGRLYLSPDTVKNHVVHIIQKLGVGDRTQAAVAAVRGGLLD